MKKTLIAVLFIVTMIVTIGGIGTASARMPGNPAQFPYSIFHEFDLEYMGSNTGTEQGVMCKVQATFDNKVRAQFGDFGYNTGSIKPSGVSNFCVTICPEDPSETVNTDSYLSSSQKNYIYTVVSEGSCQSQVPSYVIFDGSSFDVCDRYRYASAQIEGWSAHLIGLTTGTANPGVGISMIKLSNADIYGILSDSFYGDVASILSAAGFQLDKKGFWVNQCYAQPMIPE